MPDEEGHGMPMPSCLLLCCLRVSCSCCLGDGERERDARRTDTIPTDSTLDTRAMTPVSDRDPCLDMHGAAGPGGRMSSGGAWHPWESWRRG